MIRDYQAVLDRVTRVGKIRAALLVSTADGIPVAEVAMEGLEGRVVAALAASLARRVERAARSAGRQLPVFIHLQGAEGEILTARCGADLLMVAVTEPGVNAGLLRLEFHRAIELVG